jgi:branched-subunit amino acid transport protein
MRREGGKVRPEFLVLFLLVGLGTYLTRLLPLLVALRRETSEAEGGSEEPTGGWFTGALRYVGPSIIVGLLVTSVLPQPGEAFGPGLLKTGVALVPTVFVALRFRDLGLTVLVGVLFYWLVSVAV